MIASRNINTPLYWGALIALVLHMAVGFPMLTASWGVGGKSPLDSALDGSSESERRQRERVEKALKEAADQASREEELIPGVENGSDEGMTWIGYDEYKEHIAAHGEVDQAAFTEQDAAGGGALAAGENKPDPTQQPPQPAEPAQPAQPAPQPPQPENQVPPTPAVEAVSAASPAPTPAPSDQKGFAAQPTPISDLPTAPTTPDGEMPAAIDRPNVQPNPSKDPAPTAEIKPTNTPDAVAREATPPTPPTPATQPTTEQAAANGATSPVVAPVPGPPGAPGTSQAQGEKSDRESDATSIVDAPPSTWRNGKPLARKGVEVKTRRPELPILTRLTTFPQNPICEIIFGRDGVPVTCRILQSSGYPDIDGPVLDALYRWRAKGSQLDKLPPGKTLPFRVRFILN